MAKGKAKTFTELANSRGGRALRAMAALAKLANKEKYGYTPQQAAHIKETFVKAAANLGQAFERGTGKDEVKLF